MLKRWGVTLLVLGIGSFILPLFGIQFRLLNLFGSAQPLVGIGLAILGGVFLLVGSIKGSSTPARIAKQPGPPAGNVVPPSPTDARPFAARPTKIEHSRCPQCGDPLQRGDVFCGSCGYDLTATPPVPASAPVVAQPLAFAKPGGLGAPGMCGVLILMVLIIGLLSLAGISAWLWFRGNSELPIRSNYRNTGNRNSTTDNQNTNSTRAIPVPTPERVNSNQSKNSSNTVWSAWNYRATMTGENLTYYRGTTPEQCQADCDKDVRCRGFTYIRAGAYNPNDPPMCYLIAVVKELVPHDCCISAVKQ